jgi:hypothetical protein
MESETIESSLADDRLVGVEAIAAFIDPSMSPWKMQRLLATGHYPYWREGKVYVASKAALRARWIQMTRCPQPSKGEPADAA